MCYKMTKNSIISFKYRYKYINNSGDIYRLSDHQWKLIELGMNFYRKAADIIEKGTTLLQDYHIESYNHPTGNQF